MASDSTELLGIWFLNHACNHDWHGGRGFHYIKANEWNYLKRRIPTELFERWMKDERGYFEDEGYFEAKERLEAVERDFKNKLKEFSDAELDKCVALRWGDRIIRIED